jgi:putative NIF3 family GTP cyclohydrolase 1 type 2
VRFVKETLSLPGLRYADGGKQVCHVAVGGGACMELAEEACSRGCDTLVTADGKYHEFQLAQTLGINLIDAGHFGTENPVCPYLVRLLRVRFPALTVEISGRHGDVIKFC